MRNLIEKLVKDESGQDMAEYAIALGVIAAVAIAAFVALGGAVADKLTDVVGVINGGGGGGATP